MAKGYDSYQARQQALSLFGKDLARRSKSTCELSGKSNIPLFIYEIPPVPKEPSYDNCLFLSENTIQQLESAKKHLVPDQWRHLYELIWHELPTIQIISYRILTFIAKEHPWAQDILAEAYLDDAIIAQANTHPLT